MNGDHRNVRGQSVSIPRNLPTLRGLQQVGLFILFGCFLLLLSLVPVFGEEHIQGQIFGAAEQDAMTSEKGEGRETGCGDERIHYDFAFQKGYFLARKYVHKPGWLPSWLPLDYHHAGLVIADGTERETKTIEAIGYAADPNDEIQEFSFGGSPWTYKTLNRGDSCEGVKRVVVADVKGITPEQRNAVVEYALAQNGKQFHLGRWDRESSKENTDYFYCSKLVWRSVLEGTGKDIDATGGFYVTPGDLVDDDEVVQVFVWEEEEGGSKSHE